MNRSHKEQAACHVINQLLHHHFQEGLGTFHLLQKDESLDTLMLSIDKRKGIPHQPFRK